MNGKIPEIMAGPDAPAPDNASYRNLVEKLPIGVFRISSTGHIIYINPHMASLVTDTPSKTAGTGEALHLFFTPLVSTTGESADFIRTISKGGTVKDFEYGFVRHDGRQLWLCLNAYVSDRCKDGSLVIEGIATDITRLKQTEQQLEKGRREFRLIADNTLDVIWQMDLDLKFIYMNSAVNAFLGYTPEQILGRRLPELCSDEEMQKMSAIILYEIENRQAHTGVLFETSLLHKDGHTVPVEILGKLLFNDEGDIIGLQGTTRDIRERKELEKQLHQAQKMEAIGRLAGGVAHDFNNLLSVVLGYAELVLDNHPPHSIDHEPLLEIHSAADRARNLTRQLLAFSRKQVLEIRDVDINQVISGFEKLLRRVIGEDIRFRFLPSQEPLIVKADISQIEQVLMNLAINARDAMPEGGALTIVSEWGEHDIKDESMPSGTTASGFACIKMVDTGTGMDNATLSRIFEPFYTTKNKDQGTGLGLATTYGIVSQHGGHIDVQSMPGKGTQFTIYLPISDTPALAAAPTEVQVSPRPGSATIMVVEDDRAVRKLICNILSEGGYRIIESRSAVEAIELARNHQTTIDLILTDVIMPGMTGLAVYQSIAALRPDIKALYMSGYTDNVIAKHGLLSDDVQFLQKPFSRRVLLTKVQQVLRH